MARDPRFQVEDVERLFRALLPSGRVDPFGKMETLLIELGEEAAKEGVLTDEWREKVKDELADIKTRTFGILILQIFKTVKFFLGLLPSGRLILIFSAAIGLLIALSQEGSVSVGAIRQAVAQTGLAKFIDELLEELKAFAERLAANADELGFAASDVFASSAIIVDKTTQEIAGIASELEIGGDDIDLIIDRNFATALRLQGLNLDLSGVGNALSNSDVILGPALRAVGADIRTIPTMALKLVRL